MKCCLLFVVSFGLTHLPALYAGDPESPVEGVSTQVLDEEPLHQLLGSLTQDPASYLYHLSPEITDVIADHALGYWTLLHNPQRWMDAAIVAAEKDCEPEHLFEIAAVKDIFFTRLLKAREAQLATPEEWKRHALTTLLTFYGVGDAAKDAAWYAVGCMVGSFAWFTASETAWSLAVDGARYASWHAAGRIAKDVARYAAEDVAGAAAREAAKHATRHATASKAIRRTAYRVAETQSWITFLDPDKQVLQKVYAAAHASLGEDFQQHWCASQEHFHHQVDTCLVERVKDPRARQLLQSLVKHLHRIGDKIFAQENVPQV